jgi:L-asparaginase
MSAYVRVLSTGGTIASTATEDGAEPGRTGEELVRSVPEIDEYADLSVEEVAQRPSYDMDLETMAAVVERARTAPDVDGVVVTHGTDTMAESAYFADLTAGRVPLVFTGAQRRPDETSADGPANLVTAVRAAADERLHGSGRAFVAFDKRLYAARSVSKAHTSRLDAFVSPDAGPVAAETRSGLRFHRTPVPQESPFEPRVPDGRVRIVSSGAGVPRTPVDDAVASGVDGIVVDATGLGNVTTALGDGIADATESGVPVVVASRCLGGETVPVYGGGGGGETLRRHGVGFAGSLSAPNARIELLLALAQSTDPLARFES